MTTAELEERVKALESRIAQLEAWPAWPRDPPPARWFEPSRPACDPAPYGWPSIHCNGVTE